MKVTQLQIDNFFIGKRIALAGVSRDTRKFSYGTFKNLVAKGYTILPVNPNTDKIDNVKCYRNVSDLPQNVDSLLIMTPKGKTDQTLRGAIQKGIKNIWVQQMSETSETLKIAEEYQREIIFKKCIYMFTEPVAGVHRFHRTLVKIFGGIPQ
jgi:predicted CoA-binding protein